MKIGLVCPYNIFKGGGVQELVLALQSHLNARGHDCYIITPTPRQIPNKIPPKIILLGSGASLKSFHTTTQVSASVNTELLDQALHEHRFDILHFHEPWVPILSRQILSRSNCKNLATFHAKLPDTVVLRTIEKVITPYTKSILKYLDGLSAVSPAAAEYLQTLTHKPVQIVPNGIDLKSYRWQRNEPKNKNILYIGRLEKRKGLKYLILAFKKLLETNPDCQLLIAGDGPDLEKLQTFVSDWQIPGILFLGFVDNSQKLKLLSEARVFCSPALYGESFGIVLLEAMASGLPIVAGDNKGYVSVLQDSGKLSLVDPKSTNDFALKLDIMLNDQSIRKIWRKWAKNQIKQYAYPKIIDQYLKLYSQLLN